MAIVKQIIKGVTVKTLDVEALAADLTALQAILEGQVDVYDQKSTGGAVAPLPTDLNRKRFSCGNRGQNLSCSFNVKHAKATAYTPDFEAVVVGAFDAGYETTIKADYMNLLYDRN